MEVSDEDSDDASDDDDDAAGDAVDSVASPAPGPPAPLVSLGVPLSAHGGSCIRAGQCTSAEFRTTEDCASHRQ